MKTQTNNPQPLDALTRLLESLSLAQLAQLGQIVREQRAAIQARQKELCHG